MNTAKRVLLVEDDIDDQFLFCEAINQIYPEIDCKIANDGVEALSMADKLPRVDLIFMDLNMPKMSGFECLKRLKENKNLKEIPVVVLSTSNRIEDIARCKLLGAASFFPKPTSYNELFYKLKNIIAESKSC